MQTILAIVNESKGKFRLGYPSHWKVKSARRLINSKLIEESQNDEGTKYSDFEDLQDGSKQTPVAFMVCDLAI